MLFRSKQLKPTWKFNANSFIWRIFFTSKGRIVGETRNQATKTTNFFCVDGFSGRQLWSNFEFDEPWWIGIEKVYDGWLIFHGYTRPDMPEHRGIRVMEIESGKVLWRNDELSFWFAHNEKLYAFKYLFENRVGYELDIKTGTVLNEYTGNLDVLHDLKRNVIQNEAEEQQRIIFPELLTTGGIGSSVEKAIREIADGSIDEDWIEYILHEGMLLVSYYQLGEPSGSILLNNILRVYDIEKKKILFEDVVEKGLQTPGADTFFVKDEFLYFIKNKTTLTAVQPWKS